MATKVTKSQIRLVKVAERGGDAADLVFLDEFDALEKELDSIKNILVDKLTEINTLLATVRIQRGEKGDRGETGPRGANGPQGIEGKVGPKGDKGDKGDFVAGKDGIDGADGRDGSPDTREQIIEKINGESGAWLPVESIIGLPEEIKSLQERKMTFSGLMGQGGSRVTRLIAGTGVTLTSSMVGGRGVVTVSTSGANIATEALTGVQSGNNVTLNLAGLAHTYSAIVWVSRNGQILTPTSSWSRVGDTITVLNASAGNSFLINYTYA